MTKVLSDNSRGRRMHLSTCFIALIAAALLLVSNIAGTKVPALYPRMLCEHGWPFGYLVRHKEVSDDFEKIGIWSLTEDIDQFSPLALAGNVLTAFVVLGVVVVAFEAWRRRRNHLYQFKLGEMFIAIALLSGLLAWIHFRQEKFDRTKPIVDALRFDPKRRNFEGLRMEDGIVIGYSSTLPSWLRSLLGPEITIFDNVTTVDMGGMSWFQLTEKEVNLITQLPDLEVVDLHYIGVGDAWIKDLAKLPQLREADLSRGIGGKLGGLTDAGMSSVAQMEKIESLDISSSAITDVGAEKLRGLSRLKRLNLSITRITDATLQHLTTLDALEDLCLRRTNNAAAGWRPYKIVVIGGKKGVANKYEYCQTKDLDAGDLVDFAQSSRGDEFALTDEGLKLIAQITSLRRLDLSFHQFGDQGIAHLRHLENLEELNLDGTLVTDKGIESITGLQRLKVLTVAVTSLTDDAVERLGKMRSLELLTIIGTKISKRGEDRLREMLPYTVIRNESFTRATPNQRTSDFGKLEDLLKSIKQEDTQR